MDSTFNWKPEATLQEKLINFALKKGKSPESIVNEAVKLYLEKQSLEVSVDALNLTSAEEIILSERDWDILVSALENPPEPNEALKAAFKEHQEKYGKW